MNTNDADTRHDAGRVSHSCTQFLIDSETAAAMLGMGTRTLWGLTKCEAIPVRRVGRLVRYCPDELRAWVAAGCPTEPGAADRVRKGARQ